MAICRFTNKIQLSSPMEEPGRRQASRLGRGARDSIAVVGLHTQHGSRASGVARRRVHAWQSVLSPRNRAQRCARFALVRCYARPRPRVSKTHLFSQSSPQVGTGPGVRELSQQNLGFALFRRRNTAPVDISRPPQALITCLARTHAHVFDTQ